MAWAAELVKKDDGLGTYFCISGFIIRFEEARQMEAEKAHAADLEKLATSEGRVVEV